MAREGRPLRRNRPLRPRLKATRIVARASVKAAKSPKLPAPFTITVVLTGGLTPKQKQAFKTAADRWSKVIVGDLPDVLVGGQVIDDVLIEASGALIDGPGGILGQAGPTHLRPAAAGAAAFIPAKGRMQFDTADLAAMQADSTLNDVITHEMGHVLGIGTIWINKGLLSGADGDDPLFTGAAAKKEYGKLKATGPTTVRSRILAGLARRTRIGANRCSETN